ncbi:MAG: hypothetical protein WC824_04435 [Bacteroidota bacterium]|jgi:hypothetical protein
MGLLLNTWYRIFFPAKSSLYAIYVTVENDDGVLNDHFLLEMEASTDLDVEKCRMDDSFGKSLALTSNGYFCKNDVASRVYVENTPFFDRVRSPLVSEVWSWIPYIGTGLLQLTLYMTVISADDDVMPCDPLQPETADPRVDPTQRTVCGFPMVFVFPGVYEEGGGNTGKKVKVIWKKET